MWNESFYVSWKTMPRGLGLLTGREAAAQSLVPASVCVGSPVSHARTSRRRRARCLGQLTAGPSQSAFAVLALSRWTGENRAIGGVPKSFPPKLLIQPLVYPRRLRTYLTNAIQERILLEHIHRRRFKERARSFHFDMHSLQLETCLLDYPNAIPHVASQGDKRPMGTRGIDRHHVWILST